jgi:hypothetical protein
LTAPPPTRAEPTRTTSTAPSTQNLTIYLLNAPRHPYNIETLRHPPSTDRTKRARAARIV